MKGQMQEDVNIKGFQENMDHFSDSIEMVSFEDIENCSKDFLVKNFLPLSTQLKILKEKLMYQKIRKENSDQLESFIKHIEEKIQEKITKYHLPYLYQLFFDSTKNSKNRVEMKHPTRLKNIFGKEVLLLSYNGEVRQSSIENELSIKEWVMYDKFLSHDYDRGVEGVFKEYFKPLDPVEFPLSDEQLSILPLFLSDSTQDILKHFFSESLAPIKKDQDYLSHSDIIRDGTEKQLESLSFFEFISSADRNLFEQARVFANTFDFTGLKTFLSLAHGGNEMGQKILDLGERLPTETASKIFAKYAEVVNSVENILNIAQNNFKTTIDTKPELMQSIEQSLYKRGADLLLQFHENIDQNSYEIIAELERINADTITTLSIFKYAVKFGNKLPLEDILGAEFSKKTGDQLSSDDVSEMEHIYQANWKNYGNQELIQSVIHKFKESLTGDNAKNEEVYLFKKNNQINAFVKFAELHPGVKYASALNVDQSSKGFGLGETMMDEALYREAQENILIATCDPLNESNMRYMEKGFVATGFTGDHPPVLNICWNESQNGHIQSKHILRDDLVMMYLKQQIPSNLVIKKAKNLDSLHSDFPHGKSLTRCFRDPLHTGDWYAVYETIHADYETSIKPLS